VQQDGTGECEIELYLTIGRGENVRFGYGFLAVLVEGWRLGCFSYAELWSPDLFVLRIFSSQSDSNLLD
jgi:hypothetical protein